MKAKREPLTLEVVHDEREVDVDAFLSLYAEALLAEARREGVTEAASSHEPVSIEVARPRLNARARAARLEGRNHEKVTIEPERRFGLLAFIS